MQKKISDKPYIVNLFVPTSIVWLSIGNNQGCVFLRVQLMIHLPWNFDTASENNISIISLPYTNQLRGILIDHAKYMELQTNYTFHIGTELFFQVAFTFLSLCGFTIFFEKMSCLQ